MSQPKIKASALDIGSGPNSVVSTDGSGNVVISGDVDALSFTGAGTGLTGTAAALSIGGNAGTATLLETARNINGTSFNGSTNITTASWGTSRTITIGDTGKAVDGSAAVSWTLTELGAVSLTASESVAGSKTFTARSAHAGAYTPTILPAFSATPTFDCATSNVFEPDVLTANVTSMTMSNQVAGQTVQIRFEQDAVGGRTVTPPVGAKIEGTPTTTANRVNWLIMTYSSRGLRWEGNWLVVPT